MTKKELVHALEGLEDSAEVHVYCTSANLDIAVYAYDVYTDDKVTGKEIENEITIVAHF